MASNHTEHFSLNQWQADDQVKRTDFNEDNAKIDAALNDLSGGLAAAQAEKADQTALDALAAEVAKKATTAALEAVRAAVKDYYDRNHIPYGDELTACQGHCDTCGHCE